MKNLVYFIVIAVFGFSCSKQTKIENEDYEYVYIDPDNVPLDYSYIDSVHHALRCKAYEIYGDSDATGLPDSVMRRKDSIERFRK